MGLAAGKLDVGHMNHEVLGEVTRVRLATPHINCTARNPGSRSQEMQTSLLESRTRRLEVTRKTTKVVESWPHRLT